MKRHRVQRAFNLASAAIGGHARPTARAVLLIAIAALSSAPVVAAPRHRPVAAKRTAAAGRAASHAAPPPPPPPPQVVYREKRGPRCIYTDDIAAAAVSGPARIDFVLHGGERVRALLGDECPALDFYRGFYLSPSADGKVCAGRDAIRTRAGGECAIGRLRELVVDAP